MSPPRSLQALASSQRSQNERLVDALRVLTRGDVAAAVPAVASDRPQAERRIADGRARVDAALAQAQEAASALQRLRSDVVNERNGPFDEERERAAMMQLVQALATSHDQIRRRYQELQMSVMIARALDAAKLNEPSGVPLEQLDEHCPAISYGAVLRASRVYGLPGDSQCAVCQSELERTDSVRMLPCRHCYHRECIDPWLTQRSRCCPTCRASVCVDGLIVSS